MTARAGLLEALARGSRELGVALRPTQREQLVDYLVLLERWNRAYNLSGVRDPREMVSRHLLDSLSIVPLVRESSLLDVGSGAGLPGLVLAVALPGCRATLLDASLKRTRFLSQAVRELGLEGVRVLRSRLEDHRPEHGYDTVVSRAALRLDALVRGAARLLAPGGRLVAMQGQEPPAAELPVPAHGALRVVALRVPGLDAARHAVVLDRAGGAGAC